MNEPRTYPDGVPSWVDTEQPDPEAAMDFYRALFGWAFTIVSAPAAPFYAIASVAGRDVAGLGAAPARYAAWNTYIAVDDVDATTARAWGAGAEIVAGPFDVGQAGRMAICNDPAGAPFRLWQARRVPGAQRVNEPGSWNFSDLQTAEPDAISFYATVFGWSVEDLGFARMVRRPGYGDHLEATVDPDIRVRHKRGGAPPGFEDAIAWVGTLEADASPHWHVTFAVEDRDATAALAERLGAELLDAEETQWTRTALVRDPQGALFTASQFTPGGGN